MGKKTVIIIKGGYWKGAINELWGLWVGGCGMYGIYCMRLKKKTQNLLDQNVLAWNRVPWKFMGLFLFGFSLSSFVSLHDGVWMPLFISIKDLTILTFKHQISKLEESYNMRLFLKHIMWKKLVWITEPKSNVGVIFSIGQVVLFNWKKNHSWSSSSWNILLKLFFQL